MQAEQISKESKKDDSQEPSLKKMMKKDLSEGPKVTEQSSKSGNSINGQSSQNHQNHKDNLKNDDSSSSDCIVIKHKEGTQPAVQQNTVPQNGTNEDDDDDEVQIISVSNPTKLNSGVPQRKDSGSGSISKQKKKNTNRCKVCKKGGSTSSFKACKDCARLFHYECVGMKKELDKDKKYICEQCKDKQKQKRAVEREKEKKKKIKEKEKEKERQLKIESILAEAKKKLEKPKDNKKEETQKFFEEFCAKYPQYVENKKIKFPIEDTLLTIYGEKFQDNQNLAKRPRPNQSKIIPLEFMNDILMIWNFLNSFSEHLENMKFTKEQLYIAIDHKGEESHQLLSHIFKNLVRFPVLDIYYTHKIDNHKELSDQAFFVITRVAKEIEQLDTIMQIIWPEFIRHLSFFQQYSINFKDDELIAEIIEKMKSKDFSGFFDLNTKQRIKFMCILIACVDDSDSFHDGVIGFKQEQVHEMTKERNDLQVEIKKDELEFQAVDTKVKALEQTQKEQSAAILETLSRAESLKKSKELEKEKKELQKLKNQASKLEQALNKKKNKCQQLTFDLPHYINTAQLLGYDHNKSEFWFFHNDRKTIYLRYKESIIDDDRSWCFYNTKEDITSLIKSLNKKGIREKNLYDNLMYLVKNGYLQYKFEDFEKKPTNNSNSNNNQNNATNGTQQKDAQTSSGGIQTTLSFNNKNGLTITQNGENAEEHIEMEIEEVKKPEDVEQKDDQQNGDSAKNADEENEIEETKEQIIQFISNYDAQAVINKTAPTANKKKTAKGAQQNEKELSVFQRAKCNFKDVGMIILETEKNFTDYLERRKSRWANKQTRETFRERVKNTTDPQEILTLLEQLNDGFSAVDHMYIKENARIQENEEESSKMEQEDNEDDNQSVVSDDDSFQGMGKNKNSKSNNNTNQGEKQLFTLEYFESNPQMRSKKLPMRIWGIYSEKCKKNWQNLPMVNVMSAYLSAYLFCSIIQRFLLRKKEQQQEKALYEQNNQISSYYVNDDKKNINSSTSLTQKRKLTPYSEIDTYKYTDSSLRRSDRQRYRKDLTEPSYDLEDFEEEEGQEEVDQDNKEEEEEEEFVHKSNKNKKGGKKSNKNEDEDEEEYDADKIEDEDDIEESDEDEQEDDKAEDEEDEEEEEKVVKKGGKRKLTKQKDLKKKKARDENEEDMEEEENDEEEEVKQKPIKKVIVVSRGKQSKKQAKENDSEEEEEFQFYKKKEDKNDKKPKYKEESEEENDQEEEEEEVLTYNKSKNNKNNKSKEKPSLKSKQEWDEQCKVCKHHGEVLMCDTCPSVFHLKCIGLKSLPEGEWSCLECQQKLLKQRQTRSAAKKHKI